MTEVRRSLLRAAGSVLFLGTGLFLLSVWMLDNGNLATSLRLDGESDGEIDQMTGIIIFIAVAILTSFKRPCISIPSP